MRKLITLQTNKKNQTTTYKSIPQFLPVHYKFNKHYVHERRANRTKPRTKAECGKTPQDVLAKPHHRNGKCHKATGPQTSKCILHHDSE